MREGASGGEAAIFPSPLAFTASLPNQKHSRTKSSELKEVAEADLLDASRVYMNWGQLRGLLYL